MEEQARLAIEVPYLEEANRPRAHSASAFSNGHWGAKVAGTRASNGQGVGGYGLVTEPTGCNVMLQ
jgi:hypothetical protein